ncbi:hypothetical protein [Arthrobacter sp. NPDC089319]|uniref:hypothetical protein n=1 Tax=Arthrobacter sp. NPDC089319 TaxID=3155915 RepID=UPI0034129421
MEALPGEPGTRSFAISEALVTGAMGAALGPAAAMVSAGFFSFWNAAAMERWAQYVDSRLAKMERALDPHDHQAMAIFNKLTFAALQTSRHDKWALLVDALAYSGSTAPNPDYVQEMFADYVIKYTPQHVKLLYLAASPNEWLKAYGEGVSAGDDLRDVVRSHVFAMTDDFELMSDSVWADLYADGMLVNRPGGAGTIEEVFQNGWMATEKGRRFLRHLGREA